MAPLIAVDNDTVVVEAVKLAEDRSGDVIVRLYESRGGRARAVLAADFPITAATESDLLERPMTGSAVSAPTPTGAVPLTLRPFQILTVRLHRA